MMQMIIALDEEKFDTREQLHTIEREIRDVAMECGICNIDGCVYKGCDDSEDFVRFGEFMMSLISDKRKYLPFMGAWYWDEFDVEYENDIGAHYTDDVLAEVYEGEPYLKKKSTKTKAIEKLLPMFFRKQRKQITFDLSRAKQEKEFKKTNYTEGYRQLRIFLEAERFVKTQHSVYCSKDKMSKRDVFNLIDRLIMTTPKTCLCIKGISITNILEMHNMVSYIEKKAHKEKKVQEEKIRKEKEQKKKKQAQKKKTQEVS